MLIAGIDELNTFSVEPEKYFGEMDLTEEQKEERIRFTEKANEELLNVMHLIVAMFSYNDVDYAYVRTYLEERWMDLIAGFVVLDDYLAQYVLEKTIHQF